MSPFGNSKEASSNAISDSIKVSSDGESLAQFIFKLEMNLSKEIKENLAVGNDKMLAEFIKVRKNFEDMFDRMDHQEEATQKIRSQLNQLNTRFEKFERDQENLYKRTNGLVASGALKTNSYELPVSRNSMNNARPRAPFNANVVRPQHQQAQNPRNRTFVSKFVKADLPEEKPQFSSNGQKFWTVRGDGMFAESNSSSDDEHNSQLVSESPVSAKLSDCVTTAMGSVSKSTVNSVDVSSDSESQESEGAEILEEKTIDGLTFIDALKRFSFSSPRNPRGVGASFGNNRVEDFSRAIEKNVVRNYNFPVEKSSSSHVETPIGHSTMSDITELNQAKPKRVPQPSAIAEKYMPLFNYVNSVADKLSKEMKLEHEKMLKIKKKADAMLDETKTMMERNQVVDIFGNKVISNTVSITLKDEKTTSQLRDWTKKNKVQNVIGVQVKRNKDGAYQAYIIFENFLSAEIFISRFKHMQIVDAESYISCQLVRRNWESGVFDFDMNLTDDEEEETDTNDDRSAMESIDIEKKEG